MQLPTVADAHKVPEEPEQRVADHAATLVETNQRLRHEIKERKHAEQTIRKERQYLQYLLDLQDRDRQLISCELHDGLVQQLAGAIMRFEAGHLDAGLELLRACMKEARWLINGLRPPILDECGLVAAIEDLVSQDSGEGEPTVEFTHKIACDRLPCCLENAIFRIIQESLTNARRHSQSMKVRIRLVRREDGIRIEVEDWGIGFNPRQIAEGHFGLKGINERARLFGGAAIIWSSPGKGTRIVVDLPLAASSLDTVARRQSVSH